MIVGNKLKLLVLALLVIRKYSENLIIFRFSWPMKIQTYVLKNEHLGLIQLIHFETFLFSAILQNAAVYIFLGGNETLHTH